MSEETTAAETPSTPALGLAHETFGLALDKVIEGSTPAIEPCDCEFTYIWDFPRGTGLAHLISINGVRVDIVLHPTGIAGMLAFMSDISPMHIDINGTVVIITRVILDIKDGDRQGAIMFATEDGVTIQANENLNEDEMDQINAHVAGLAEAGENIA